MQHSQVVLTLFLVPRSDSPELLQPVDCTLHQVAFPVQQMVKGAVLPFVPLLGDSVTNPAPSCCCTPYRRKPGLALSRADRLPVFSPPPGPLAAQRRGPHAAAQESEQKPQDCPGPPPASEFRCQILPSITTTLPQLGQFLAGNRFAEGTATKLSSAWTGRHGEVLKVHFLRTVVVILLCCGDVVPRQGVRQYCHHFKAVGPLVVRNLRNDELLALSWFPREVGLKQGVRTGPHHFKAVGLLGPPQLPGAGAVLPEL